MASSLQSVGLSNVVIAGFLGNIEHESSFDSSRVGDSGSAFGHVQWRADRVENFKRVTGVHPKNATAAQSAKFIKWELDNPGKAGMTVKQRDRILSAKTPEEAARFIDQFYERSDGKSRAGRETAARKYFGGGTFAGGDPVTASAIPQIAPEYAPERPSVIEQANQGDEVVTAYSMGARLSPEDRARVGDFLRGLRARIEGYEVAAEKKRHDETAVRFTDRFYGIGSYPTISELQQARLRNEISAQDLSSFARIIEADEERRVARIEASTKEADAAAEEADRERREQRIQSLLAPVYGKSRSISENNAELLRVAATISDPSERQELLGAVRSEINAIADSRERTPGYVKMMDDFDGLERSFASRLRSTLRPGPQLERALSDVKGAVDRYRVSAGRAATDKGFDPAAAFGNSERQLVDAFVRKYAPK
jgi:hypothetical protein